MFTLAKGWTKTKVMNRIKKYNNGKQAMTSTAGEVGVCLYKAKGGNRCAIGCFIPDGHPAFKERLVIEDLLGEYPDLRKHMPFKDDNALIEFQHSHDKATDRAGGSVYASIEQFLKDEVEGK